MLNASNVKYIRAGWLNAPDGKMYGLWVGCSALSPTGTSADGFVVSLIDKENIAKEAKAVYEGCGLKSFTNNLNYKVTQVARGVMETLREMETEEYEFDIPQVPQGTFSLSLTPYLMDNVHAGSKPYRFSVICVRRRDYTQWALFIGSRSGLRVLMSGFNDRVTTEIFDELRKDNDMF